MSGWFPHVFPGARFLESPMLVLLGWMIAAVAVVAIMDAARRARFGAPDSHRRTWALATVAVLAGHLGGVTLAGGERLHFLGAAWLALMLGYPRAVLSLSAIVLARLLLGDEPLSSWGTTVMVDAVGPVWAMWWIVEGCKRFLPPNPFVFLLGCALFGVALVNLAQTTAAVGVDALFATSPAAQWGQYLPFGLLLGWGEALLEAMVTTVLVVYVPGVVAAFDERFYLRRG